MPGYFAFPPQEVPPERSLEDRASTENSNGQPPPVSHNTRTSDEDVQTESKDRQQRATQEGKRRAKVEREQREVYLSELAWVRSGGILRDAQGRRDKVRTEAMQKEIRLQNEEKIIMDRWETYEARWRTIYTSSGSVSWGDIPWPSIVSPESDTDITPSAVHEFIFATFTVRGMDGPRKSRIRTSLLRWHPDKLSAVVARVPDEEQDMVRNGVNAVFMCLKQLQDEEKQRC